MGELSITKIRSPGAYRWFHARDPERSGVKDRLGWDTSLCGLSWPEVFTEGFVGFDLCLACLRRLSSEPPAS